MNMANVDPPMETIQYSKVFHRLAEALNDGDTFKRVVAELEESELTQVLEHLVRLRLIRDKCARDVREKFKEEHGCSSSLYYTRLDPEKYEKRKEYNRLYKQRKRNQEKAMTPPAVNAVQCV
jgi:Skp family chaperone for outer membrane proteins